MESDGDTDKCIYTAEVKTSLYILDKKVKRGCLKIELRWPLLFYFKLKSFGFFSKKEAYKLTFSIQTVFYWYKPPKRLFLQDYVQWPAGRTQFQPS